MLGKNLAGFQSRLFHRTWLACLIHGSENVFPD